MFHRYLFIIFLFTGGCASIEGRSNAADKVASAAHMQKSLIKTDDFTLTAYKKIDASDKALNIYIEGDGFAWATRTQVSTNPTPRDIMMLELAAIDPAPNVVYLARPCQYTPFEFNNTKCDSKFWTDSRFSEAVIRSMNQAVDKILLDTGAKKINLIGYSGGAAVAVLLASRRNDVESLRTVAGNLDPVAVNKYYKVSQLRDSLNPIDYANKISNIPQYHFAGEADKVVPQFVAEDFIAKSNKEHSCARLKIVKNATHYSGWREVWRDLMSSPLECADKNLN